MKSSSATWAAPTGPGSTEGGCTVGGSNRETRWRSHTPAIAWRRPGDPNEVRRSSGTAARRRHADRRAAAASLVGSPSLDREPRSDCLVASVDQTDERTLAI